MTTDITVLDGPVSHHGEGPVYDAVREVLHWVDLTAGVVHSRDVDGSTSSQRYPGEITAIVPHSGGALIAATSDGFAALDAGHLTPLASPLGQDPAMRMNDGAAQLGAGRAVLCLTPTEALLEIAHEFAVLMVVRLDQRAAELLQMTKA